MTEGHCYLCGEIVAKSRMSMHLKTCRKRNAEGLLLGESELRETELMHLVVEDERQGEYWLHLDVPADAPLAIVDQFLREIWVECCGHLSQFSIRVI